MNGHSASPPWWRGAVIYQIYPRSFRDTDGDGVGDLRGITGRLAYVRDLGVDAVWLSPFFPSPMKDFGYDVSDFRGVDPLFGTLADFDALVAEADRLGLAIIIDQVYSHTSDQHPWFRESASSTVNPKADWYVWADPRPDGTPPNNWLSIFGGPSWTWSAARQQYYLHNYLPSQPDLNLHNPEVQEELLACAAFWLDRGVKGFRLDALHCAMHDRQLRDNPPRPRGGRDVVRPYDLQWHRYDHGQPEVALVLERFRQLTDRYGGTFTVAEVGADDPLPIMKDYTAEGRLQSAYSFQFLWAPRLTADHVRRTLSDWPGTGEASWPSWAFSNHDAVRAVSRWQVAVPLAQRARLFALLMLSLRGNVFVYQGEELGLPQADVPFDRLRDPEAIANWPHTLGRDGARTPMPWVCDDPHAGFASTEPWLPVDPAHHALAVDRQHADPDSVLSFFRKLIEFRRTSPALRGGDLRLADGGEGDILMFERSADGEGLVAVFNLADRAGAVAVPEGGATLFSVGGASLSHGGLTLPPWSGALVRLTPTQGSPIRPAAAQKGLSV